MFAEFSWIFALGPAALAGIGFAAAATVSGRALADRATLAAAFALACAIAAAATVAFAGARHADILTLKGAGISFAFDALSTTMFVLVGFVGLVVVRFSRNYLDGDPQHARFVRRLCLTVAAVQFLVVSGNLVQLLAAWIATSLLLNKLLLFYAERPAARLAARKKFVVSRLSDAALALAALLLFANFGSFDVQAIAAAAKAAAPEDATLSLHVAALLVVLAALLKSAQFPLHGWILEVMETPTPVSALLHAGIVNAGGFLVLRLSDAMALSGTALDALAVVGAVTALLGSLVMLTQTSVKVSLAYSTVAQMGFMLLQCGLGAFSAALLHIVAHSLYKAHAFLSSGSVIDLLRASWSPSPGGQPHPARNAIALACVLGVAFAVAALFGADLGDKPGVFALGAIMLLGVALYVSNAIDERPNMYVLGVAAATAAAVAVIYFALQAGTEAMLQGAVAPTQALDGPFDLVLVGFVILAFAAVTLLQGELGRRTNGPFWQSLYVHLSNGLYVNSWANRLTLRLWPQGDTK
ncbi:MAG: NADH-quinone oxidoreductase subunit L [Magnetospirillum sp.]|nr:NADH-quinone oxidoreductase subunit L [Magnetospirillum sp.]